jgi:hypothetical protein
MRKGERKGRAEEKEGGGGKIINAMGERERERERRERKRRVRWGSRNHKNRRKVGNSVQRGEGRKWGIWGDKGRSRSHQKWRKVGNRVQRGAGRKRGTGH